jgi:hypothetical protein
MFKETPLARCEGQWAVYDVIKQYLGNTVKNEVEGANCQGADGEGTGSDQEMGDSELDECD